MSSEESFEDIPVAKKQKLSPSSSPTPSSSWTPSVPAPEAENESCDSGLSDSGVTTPPVQEEQDVPDTGPGSSQEIDRGGGDDDDDDSLSGLSDMSGQDWKPDMSSKLTWLHAAMRRGENPRDILETLLPSGSEIPDSLDNMTMWKILFNLLSEPPRRQKLENVNTLEHCVDLIKNSSNIIILTGAGVSVSCGIPDFRSRDGVYARLAVDFPDLPDPQAMFDIQYFKKDPRPFFKFAREIYPGQFQPSPCHKFIKCVESSGKLLRNYTQNIDTLEQVAGINNVIQCHGSFATASCMVCKRKVNAESIKEEIFNQTIPKCGLCPEPETDSSEPEPRPEDHPEVPPINFQPQQLPVMKPDIVFFGEGLPDHFHECISRDKTECDLLIVIGSSLKVRPVALIPSSLPPSVPQILINREPLPHLTFDVELLGDCDRIVNQLCLKLAGDVGDWSGPVHQEELTQHTGLPASLLNDKKDPNTDNMTQAEDSTKDENKTEIGEPSMNNDNSESPTVEKDGSDDEDEWKVKSLADHIPDGQFLFLPPSRYVFPGAELYPDSSDDEDDDDPEERQDDDSREETRAEGSESTDHVDNETVTASSVIDQENIPESCSSSASVPQPENIESEKEKPSM